MAANVTFEWFPQALRQTALPAIERLIDAAAVEIVAVAEPPIDTGFLRHSAYVNSSSGRNTFGDRWPDGSYLSRRSGIMVRRTGGGTVPVPPPKLGAIAGWNAPYTIAIEERRAFIYGALLNVAARK